jgi:phosphoglucosamine mutase
MSNLGFENYLNEILDVKLIRTAVGDTNVIKEMQDNLYSLGGEQSGHIIIGEYSKTGDGILVALKILEILYKSKLKTSELFNIYNSYPQKKINLPLSKKLNKKIIIL